MISAIPRASGRQPSRIEHKRLSINLLRQPSKKDDRKHSGGSNLNIFTSFATLFLHFNGVHTWLYHLLFRQKINDYVH